MAATRAWRAKTEVLETSTASVTVDDDQVVVEVSARTVGTLQFAVSPLPAAHNGRLGGAYVVVRDLRDALDELLHEWPGEDD